MLAKTINTIFIERVGNGGFIIRSQPPEAYFASSTLAAVSTLDEALDFIRTKIWTPASQPEEKGLPEIPEGFTTWNGIGGPPVLDFQTVTVILRNGKRTTDVAKEFRWEHHWNTDCRADSADIVAYRIEP